MALRAEVLINREYNASTGGLVIAGNPDDERAARRLATHRRDPGILTPVDFWATSPIRK